MFALAMSESAESDLLGHPFEQLLLRGRTGRAVALAAAR